MVNPELKSYVEICLKQGFSEEQVKKVLEGTGWKAADVEAALVAVRNGEPAPNLAAIVAQGQPTVASTDGAGSGAGATATDPMAVALKQSTRPIQEAGLPEKPHRSLKPVLLTAGAALAVLLIGGAVTVAYQKGLLSFGQPSDVQLLAGLGDALGSVDSASYEVSIAMKSEPREADAQPFMLADAEAREEQGKYDRDTQRLADAYAIYKWASNQFAATAKYPQALPATSTWVDPGTRQRYQYKGSGSGYQLTLTFETQDAISVVSEYRSVAKPSGLTVILNEKDYIYPTKVKPHGPQFLEVFGQASDEYQNYLPLNMDVALTLGGSTRSADASSTDASFRAAAHVNFSDFSAAAEAEFLKKSDTYYFKVNKFPALFGADIGPLRGKWVAVTPQDIGSIGGGLFFSFSPSEIEEIANEGRENTSGAFEQIRTFYRMAAEQGAVVLSGNGGTETVDGIPTRHLQLAFKKDKLAEFYASAARESEQKYGDKALLRFDAATEAYLKSAAFGELFDYFQKNTSFDLWINPKSGLPVKLGYSFRIVPSDKALKLKDTQYLLSLSLSLKNVNAVPEIVAPADALSFDDAQMAISGLSKEEFMAEKQISQIQSITSALRNYKGAAGSYPKTLNGLLLTYGEAAALAPANSKSTYYYPSSTPIMSKLPQDVYGGTYGYALQGADFALTYMIKMPPAGQRSGNGYYLEEVVEGKNTATSKTLSVEGARNLRF